MDNDVYNHVNNTHYYSFFDTVVNHFLVKRAKLDVRDVSRNEAIGLCVHSNCTFHSTLEYPEVITAACFVSEMGKSSMTYQIGLFDEHKVLAATGTFVHVFVDPSTRRPSSIPQDIRTAVETEIFRPKLMESSKL